MKPVVQGTSSPFRTCTGGLPPGVLSCDQKTIDTIIQKVRPLAKGIHGDRQQATLFVCGHALTKAERQYMYAVAEAMHNMIVLSAPQMRYWRLIEAVFIFAPPGVKPQQWHADTRRQYVGQNTVFQGYSMPTEFADLEYNSLDVEDKELPSVAEAMDLPKSWASLKPAKHWQGLQGRLLVVPFYTDTLHRGPSVPKEAVERVSFYAAWGPPRANTRRFVDEEFWHSLIRTQLSLKHPVEDRTPLEWTCIRCTYVNQPKQLRCEICLCKVPRNTKLVLQTCMTTLRKAGGETATLTSVDLDLGGLLDKELDTTWKSYLKNLKRHDKGANGTVLRKVAPYLPYFICECLRDTVDGQDPLSWYPQAPLFFCYFLLLFTSSLLLSLSLSLSRSRSLSLSLSQSESLSLPKREGESLKA